jgi:hypothetical protein
MDANRVVSCTNYGTSSTLTSMPSFESGSRICFRLKWTLIKLIEIIWRYLWTIFLCFFLFFFSLWMIWKRWP